MWQFIGSYQVAELSTVTSRREGPEDQGHALCGPVAVKGARPGLVHVQRDSCR
jgi:hypothetical protein